MKWKVISVILISFFVSDCDDLDVANPNDPTFSDYYETYPENIEKLAASLIKTWYDATTTTSSLASPLHVASDAGSNCCYAKYYQKEPRIEYNNKPSFVYAYQNEDTYTGFYKTLTDANAILGLLGKVNAESLSCPEEIVRAVAVFAQGISLGYLGLVYDKAFIVTQNTNLSRRVETSPYSVIIDSAIVSLDKAIALCHEFEFTVPSEWLPGDTWNNEELAQLASSFAARLLVYSSRNKNEDNETDWAKVYDYASNGIQKDFAPLADDNVWYPDHVVMSAFGGFGYTDMYVVHLMDPGMPAHFATSKKLADMPNNGLATSQDQRLLSDFSYVTWTSFGPTFEYYFWSSYRYKRYDEYFSTWSYPIPLFRKAENDYLLAEAAVHTGKLQEAADIMNASPRVTRGELPPLSADMGSILAAIHYERFVELMLSGFGIQYFHMRKEDKLQKGTPLHFPIPGSQLERMNMPYYTFGGTTGVPGVDISNGGW